MQMGLQLLIFLILFAIFIPLLGKYMAAIFYDKEGSVLYRMEAVIYRWCMVDPKKEMSWKRYAKALLCFNTLGFIFLFLLQMLQGFLPLNPQNFKGVDFALALNTAISFTTNTNWQAYGGETTLSYLTQMLGLTVQNFLSAATGLAVLVALTRGIVRKNSATIGNFWVDLTRALLYLLIPLSIILSFILISQGVIQNFNSYIEVNTLEKTSQILPMGPAASQIAIKQLGTNGGGFFNANSAHPFENPTPLSNFFEMLAILLIPTATVYMYGLYVNSKKQCFVIFAVMLFLFSFSLLAALISDQQVNATLVENPVLEGQETRFARVYSHFWAIATTATSNGSVNSALSSLSPLVGGAALFNMMIGEVIFGGIGVGLCSMLMFILLTVFLCGLMVGRTPEYLGKKIEKAEIQWVMVAILMPCALILVGSSLAILLPDTLKNATTTGPHGLTEILYTFTSAALNNGSSFAGIHTNTYFYNLILSLVMLLGRVSIIFPSLAIAGSLANKKATAPSIGTFATDTYLFGILLFNIIIMIGALTFFPALALGPFVEQLLMLQGQAF